MVTSEQDLMEAKRSIDKMLSRIPNRSESSFSDSYHVDIDELLSRLPNREDLSRNDNKFTDAWQESKHPRGWDGRFVRLAQVSDGMLKKLASSLLHGKRDGLYKFVEKNRDFIEFIPKLELDGERYIKKQLKIKSLDETGHINTPKGIVKIMPNQYRQHLLGHKSDATRLYSLPMCFATLTRPNAIVKVKETALGLERNRLHYLKVFYDKIFKPHLTVVSVDREHRFITHYKIGLELFEKKMNGNIIYEASEDM